MEKPSVVINTAVAGRIQKGKEIGCKQIQRIIYEILSRSADYADEKYGFSGNLPRVNLFAYPGLADSVWYEFADNREVFLQLIVEGKENLSQVTGYESTIDSVVNIGADASAPAGKAFLSEWLCSQADIALLFWNGMEEGVDSDIFYMLSAFRRKKIPVIWIDSNDPESIHWATDTYYEKYDSRYLREYIKYLLGGCSWEEEAEVKDVPFMPLWRRIYNRFMKKNKAQLPAIPFAKDILLEPESTIHKKGKASEIQKYLSELFRLYDLRAGKLSGNYNASMYFRAIIPFYITIVLAFAFYSETVFGFLYIPGYSSHKLILWSLVAGVAFFLHAALNYYVYTMSKNREVISYRKKFLYNRYLAEFFRVSIHFVPYGFPSSVDFNGANGYDKERMSLYLNLRVLLRNMTPFSIVYDKDTAEELFLHLEEMMEDQIAYHARQRERYQKIVERLNRMIRIFFYTGFVFILLRGILQLILVPLDLGNINHFGINLKSFIKSLANMLALLLPAWASYFTGKLSLCNFDGLLRNNQYMEERLIVFKNMVSQLRIKNKPGYESMFLLSREIMSFFTGEVHYWYMQMETRNFTKL